MRLEGNNYSIKAIFAAVYAINSFQITCVLFTHNARVQTILLVYTSIAYESEMKIKR